MCEICSKLTIKTYTPFSSVSIVKFEHVIASWVLANKYSLSKTSEKIRKPNFFDIFKGYRKWALTEMD